MVGFANETPTGATYRVMDDDWVTEGFGDDEFMSHEDFYHELNSSLWHAVHNKWHCLLPSHIWKFRLTFISRWNIIF